MSPQRFPHLRPAEAHLWARWLTRYGAGWKRFAYDVRVGRGRPGDPSAPPEIQRDWQLLTQQRIDAVGWQDGGPTLFEVSPRAGRAAYGALLLYRDLYQQTYPAGGVPHLALVTNRIHPDIQQTAEANGITVYIIPEDFEGT
jgi:hypothetical protein